MVLEKLPPQQPKDDTVIKALRSMIQSKATAESIASQLPGTLSKAVAKSSRLMAEDLCREAGFMLPQSGNTKEKKKKIRSIPGIPTEAVNFLLENLKFNEEVQGMTSIAKWRCTVCGYIHEGDAPPDNCPVCKQPKEKFQKL